MLEQKTSRAHLCQAHVSSEARKVCDGRGLDDLACDLHVLGRLRHGGAERSNEVLKTLLRALKASLVHLLHSLRLSQLQARVIALEQWRRCVSKKQHRRAL